MNPTKPRKKNRLQLLHQYYSYTGFYSFIKDALKKAVPAILIVVGILLLINYFVIDVNTVLTYVIDNYSDFTIIFTFLLSESILGIIPPELFIAWSGKTASPFISLTLLATMSYLGGIFSFFTGQGITKIPAVHNYLEVKMKKHIKNTRKWGGLIIAVGALLPIPFAMTSIAAGMIKYKFTNYLLFGALRYVRFYAYALVIFKLV
jgi:membrane protein YqaA with SNARE-associated domain